MWQLRLPLGGGHGEIPGGAEGEEKERKHTATPARLSGQAPGGTQPPSARIRPHGPAPGTGTASCYSLTLTLKYTDDQLGLNTSDPQPQEATWAVTERQEGRAWEAGSELRGAQRGRHQVRAPRISTGVRTHTCTQMFTTATVRTAINGEAVRVAGTQF